MATPTPPPAGDTTFPKYYVLIIDRKGTGDMSDGGGEGGRSSPGRDRH